MGKTKIEWATDSWNPIRARNRATGKIGWHCEHESDGCRYCYAEGMNKRLGTGLDFKPGHRKDIEIFLDEKMLLAPLRWKRPRMVFVCSMTDLFAEFVRDEWIDHVFAVMALCPQHTFQVLTKRAARMREYLSAICDTFHASADCMNERFGELCVDLTGSPCAADAFDNVDWPLHNVWLGVSAERQQEADERIPLLLETSATVRFVSLEPLLGPIDLTAIPSGQQFGECILTADALRGPPDMQPGERLDWVIVGGESGPHARPMHPQWARDIRDQCAEASVNFFFKQWGEFAYWRTMCESDERRTWIGKNGKTYNPSAPVDQDCWAMVRVGKKAAGRRLDGVQHNAIPLARHREASPWPVPRVTVKSGLSDVIRKAPAA